MKLKHCLPSLLFCSLFSCITMVSNAQTYLKSLARPELNFRQKLTRFGNGDLLIADSSIEPLRTGNEEGIVYLSRMDNCGRTLWSYRYQIREGYLECKDIKINERDEVFVYGSFYKGLDEFIFLLKTDADGLNKDYTIWSTGTVDHFSYSIDIKNGQVMIYGLMLGYQTQKQGFVAIFDENLNFRWAKRFVPFESNGHAILTADGGILGFSGEYLIKLNASGDYQWAKTLTATPNAYTVNGPLELADGYVFQAISGTNGFFYKLDFSGNLLWQSTLYQATETGTAMTCLDDGTILSTYNRNNGNFGILNQLHLSATGQINQQSELILPFQMNPGFISQSIYKRQITIAVNENPFKAQGTDLKDFLFQFPLEFQTDQCFLWQDFDDLQPNTIQLNLTPYSFESEAFEIQPHSTLKSEAEKYEIDFQEQCETNFDLDALTTDTLLPCEADYWEIQLPSPDFYWVDGTSDTIRQIEESGIYTARNRDCINRIEVDFHLTKENCGCPVFLPNAFSPNGDDINDELVLFSDCPLTSINYKVFNRWGEHIFLTEKIGQYWNGTFRQNEAPPGIYLVAIRYEWMDEDGNLYQGSVSQEVTLIR